jgi:hypothetical protein
MKNKALLLFGALAGMPAAQANLLVNPGFEHPASNFLNALVPGNATWITGWTATGTGVHWMTEALGYFTDPIGKDAVDLANYTYANGGIKQSFATQIGTNYTVGFHGATFANPTYGEITALIDNALVGTYQLINPTSASNTWKYFSFNFTATGTTTTLEFRNTQVAGMQYSFLDNVSVEVTPVPEPETCALMLAGLSLVGFAARRRKS